MYVFSVFGILLSSDYLSLMSNKAAVCNQQNYGIIIALLFSASHQINLHITNA